MNQFETKQFEMKREKPTYKKFIIAVLVCLVLGAASFFIPNFVHVDSILGANPQTTEKPVSSQNGHNFYLEADSGRSKQAELDFAPYFSQKVSWSPCEKEEFAKVHLRCATILVPLNWGEKTEEIAPDYDAKANSSDNPIQQSIKLTLTKTEATGFKRGSILTNPGGPGGSGNSFLASFQKELPTALTSAYDFVSFDPRGVANNDYGSTAISCYDNAESEFDDIFSSSDDEQPDQFKVQTESVSDFAKKCTEKSGALINFVGTDSSVYDMNLIRALLGDDRLNYVGFSYGTKLGQVFAGIFPERVGSFVFDGVVDPNSTLISTLTDQSVGFEKVIDNFLTYCIGTGSKCPFFELDSAHKRLIQSIKDLRENPVEGHYGKKMNDTMFALGIISAMYSQSSWDYLVAALNNFYKYGDTKVLELLAYSYAEYDPDKKEFGDNQNEAFQVISCMDASDKEREFGENDWKTAKEEIKEKAPVMSKFLTGYDICSPFPKSGFKVDYDKSAPGSPDILLVANINDPATPISGAQNLEKILVRAHLMTVHASTHTAFLSAGIEEVDSAINKFILNGDIPDSKRIFGEKKEVGGEV